jgi:hypothetical protein
MTNFSQARLGAWQAFVMSIELGSGEPGDPQIRLIFRHFSS